MDHLLSKDDSNTSIRPPSSRRDRRRHRPSRRRAAAGSPPRFLGPASQTRPSTPTSRLTSDRTGRRPPRPSRGGDGSGSCFGRLRQVSAPALGAGRGSRDGCLAPWSAARWGPGKVRSGGSPGGIRRRPRALFDNPVVGHASISNARVCVVVAISISLRTRGETASLPSREATRRPAVEGMGGPPRRTTPRAAAQTGGLIAASPRSLGGRSPRAPRRRGGRVGVVKPPRARGGCLGVIRHSGVEGCEMSGGAAQRASIPEYPRPRRELKHLSTSRNRKQPRFPQ